MSHFTHIKTRFQNLSYLEKALNKLNIVHRQETTVAQDLTLSDTKLVIPQSNEYDIQFVWNGREYDLVTDMSFWEQSSPIETFIDQIAQQYASEVVIGESQKIGFQPVQHQQNSDGSTILVLERWDTND